ncbi:AzlC family ABC transporter permease [Streptococcus porcinus]|uniref:AzlC family ABC transporter permease n=1 Tax=Streptococcus porcinus TaxID=1340 RepID=A0A7V9WSP1_STRPO|nr:AzlC family ABC transporter permease [Streptococcus porcinus]MBA2796333.1 AzlC family ABC transporter permease [Streptococcus porcinus]
MKGFKEGVRDALPTAFGYISIGLAFGIIASASGISSLEVALMSALIYGGSAQFAMCALLVGGASLSAIVLTIFLVNLRNMLMSLHATTIFNKSSFWDNIAIASLITDESYGVLLGETVHNKSISPKWMHGNNVLSYVTWVSATVFGAILGNTIGDPQRFSFDFALVAMFIGLLSSQLEAMLLTEGVKKIGLIFLTVVITYLLSSLIFSENLSVLVSTLLACGTGVYLDETK